MVGDFDWDGRNEVIIYNPYVFVFIDDKGGAAPYVFMYNKTSNKVFMGIGAPAVYWGTWYDMWYGDSQVGLFADDYFAATGKNYYNTRYTIAYALYDSTYGRVEVRLNAPDLDGDGYPDFYKAYVLYNTANYIYVGYRGVRKSGTLYSAVGFSADFFSNLLYGNSLAQINSPTSTNSFGYRNTRTRAYVYVTPVTGMSWTGTQDLVKYTMQYRAKISVSVSTTTWAYAKVVLGYN
jgi:hypothetical protein